MGEDLIERTDEKANLSANHEPRQRRDQIAPGGRWPRCWRGVRPLRFKPRLPLILLIGQYRRAIPLPVTVAYAPFRRRVLRVAQLLIAQQEGAALAESRALQATIDDPAAAPVRLEALRAAAIARILVDLHLAGWELSQDGATLYALAPRFEGAAARGVDELKAIKASVQRAMSARVREQVATMSTARLVDEVEGPADPRVLSVLAIGEALAEALRTRGAAAIQPRLETARRQDGDDPTSGVNRYALFRYLRFHWSFPFGDTPGRSLPILIRDAGQPGDPVCGLLCLSSPVLRLTAREGRGGSDKQPQKGALATAISGGGARVEALGRVDLGAVKTEVLSPPPRTRVVKPPPPPVVPTPPPPKPGAGSTTTRPTAPVLTRPAPPAPADERPSAPDIEDREGVAPEPEPRVLDVGEPEAFDEIDDEPTDPGSTEAGAAVAPKTTAPPPPVQLPLSPRTKTLKAAPWEDRPIPGATAALIEIALKGDGAGLCWELRGGSPRSVLERPPAGLPRPRRLDLAVSDDLARDALATWSAARARLLAALGELGLNTASLSRAPAIPNAALETAGEAAQALVDAAATALTRLAEAEPSALPATLARDTICLHSPIRGESLLLLTPLHPLAVGAALGRADLWHQARHVPSDERGPILRALSRATPAPPRWPAPVGGALLAAAPLEGLPVYETRPTPISESTLADAAEALTRRYLELHPHARLGLKVLIDGENCGPLIEGVAEAILADAGGPTRVTVFALGVPALSERAGPVVSEGRITLAPLPASPAERAALAPHLEILVPQLRPPAPSGAPTLQVDGPFPRPARRVVEGGWEVHTPARAVVGGAAVEAAVVAALGEPPQGAFIARISAPPISGSAQADRGTWRAVLAPQLGAAPRVGPLVIIDERLPDARLAVLSQDVRAVARAMTESFQVVGVRDIRPSSVESLVKQLARAAGGALPLEGSLQRALVARVLERVVVEGLGDGAVVTQAQDEHLRAIQAELRAGGMPVVVGAALGRTLSVKIGVALIDLAPDAALPEAALSVIATVGAWALRVGKAEKLAGSAARGLMAELLWPRLAAMAPRGEALAWLLDGSAATDVVVSAVALVPAGHGLVGKAGLKAGDVGVEVLALDHTLMQRVVLGAG